MKKTFVIALAALVAGASFNATLADKKKKKEKAQPTVEAPAPVVLAAAATR
ncbi:MAG: hypothetical protein IJ892_06860 [Prevotella sp.]|nr:hypothetical protein [Prevotella sp.]